MSRRDPKLRLLHMRDFARKAIELTRGKTRADLENDEVLRLAVTHLLELVGEAAGKVARNAGTLSRNPVVQGRQHAEPLDPRL